MTPVQVPAAAKKVSFGKATVIPTNRKRVTQNHNHVQAKWYTESELMLIEVENKRLVQTFGVSRGLELVYDEVSGQNLEAFQGYHSSCVLALQREQRAAGMSDPNALRRLSMGITHESSLRAQERAISDFMDTAGIVMFDFNDIEVLMPSKQEESGLKRSKSSGLFRNRRLGGAAA